MPCFSIVEATSLGRCYLWTLYFGLSFFETQP
jgi:hypothetical protein